jgi:hypothetical protein
MLVRAPSKWADADARGHRHVSLLWPPAYAGGYSLIVDGVAQSAAAEAEQQLSISPTPAVLHRRGHASDNSQSPCASDCVPVFSS